MLKDWNVLKRLLGVSCVAHASRLSFFAVELFYSFVNCRKLIIMQIILLNLKLKLIIALHTHLFCIFYKIIFISSPVLWVILWVSCNILLVPLLMNDSNMSLTHVHLYLYENHDFLFKFFFFFNQFEGHPLRWIHLRKLVNGVASEVHLLSSLSPIMSFPGSQRWISSSNRI